MNREYLSSAARKKLDKYADLLMIAAAKRDPRFAGKGSVTTDELSELLESEGLDYVVEMFVKAVMHNGPTLLPRRQPSGDNVLVRMVTRDGLISYNLIHRNMVELCVSHRRVLQTRKMQITSGPHGAGEPRTRSYEYIGHFLREDGLHLPEYAEAEE